MNGKNTVILFEQLSPRIEYCFGIGSVYIRKNVWLAFKVTFLRVIHNIFLCVVVGAGTVINSDVLGSWIYGGIPEKPFKFIERFEK